MMAQVRQHRVLRALVWSLCGAIAVGVLCCVALYWWFSPQREGEVALVGLDAAVTVSSDALGIPVIHARSRADALQALGYLNARDRLFQMDLLRRQSAGELAEIFGEELLEADVQQRHLGMAQAARAITARLPIDQRAALDAYVRGVNDFLATARALPLEFTLLGYRPRAWRAEDSMLVVLSIFQVLNGGEALERTRTLLARRAPAELVRLVYASRDPYTEKVLGTLAGYTPTRQPSAAPAFAAVRSRVAPSTPLLHPRAGEARPGSNAWAVAGTRTRDGRAILANDMHLDLAVPNIWYRAELDYAGRALQGVVLPGVPLVVAGSNGKVAWGLTNLEGDVLDLIELELHPEHSDQYRTPRGFQRFATRRERIKVRGASARTVEMRSTMWGPVLPGELLGRPMALRWSALDPAAVDLGLLAIDGASDVASAARVLNEAGMPPLNAILADAGGHIGWTLTGRIPRRVGFDGASARSWADGTASWNGYVDPRELPRIVDPEAGIIINANQRMPARPDDPLLGHDFGNGYRAYRIAERLAASPKVSEQDLFALQLDTRSELYDLYRDVALEALDTQGELATPLRNDVRRSLEAWNGRADTSSIGFALLVRFRRVLVERVLQGWFGAARAAEPGMKLDFADLDTPLHAALTAEGEELFAFAPGGRTAVLQAALAQAAGELRAEHSHRSLASIRWGDVSRMGLEHPLGALPGLGSLLNMPEVPLAGCGACVRMAAGTLGASERLVVSPGHEDEGLLHMPAGQSGNPLSAHYRDQQRAWVEGLPVALRAGPTQHALRLVPEADPTRLEH